MALEVYGSLWLTGLYRMGITRDSRHKRAASGARRAH